MAVCRRPERAGWLPVAGWLGRLVRVLVEQVRQEIQAQVVALVMVMVMWV